MALLAWQGEGWRARLLHLQNVCVLHCASSWKAAAVGACCAAVGAWPWREGGDAQSPPLFSLLSIQLATKGRLEARGCGGSV